MTYLEKLQQSVHKKKSVMCVGIDPNPDLIPARFFSSGKSTEYAVLDFCEQLIKISRPYTAAYKINTAYFEALGPKGFEVMYQVAEQIPSDTICIADAKRGDIAHTALQYKVALFDQLKADAVTLNPLLGFDTLESFLDDEEKAAYILTLTSNPGAADFLLRPFENRATFSEYIAEALKERQISSQTILGMVVGATQTSVAESVLKANSHGPLLIPGIGAQGAAVSDIQKLLSDHKGLPLISISRGISYPKISTEADWEEAVLQSCKDYHKQLEPISGLYV